MALYIDRTQDKAGDLSAVVGYECHGGIIAYERPVVGAQVTRPEPHEEAVRQARRMHLTDLVEVPRSGGAYNEVRRCGGRGQGP